MDWIRFFPAAVAGESPFSSEFVSRSCQIPGDPDPRGKAIPVQYARLQAASELATVSDSSDVKWDGTVAAVTFALPRQGVSLLVFDWSIPAR